jgi:hypothetical protein
MSYDVILFSYFLSRRNNMQSVRTFFPVRVPVILLKRDFFFYNNNNNNLVKSL